MTTTEEITVPEYITDTSRRGPTRGMAWVVDGQVLKNPDPIIGETYLIWSQSILDNASPIFIATYLGMYAEEPLFSTLAYVPQPPDEETAPEVRTTTGQQNIADKVWVKARFATVPLTESQLEYTADRMQSLRRELSEEQAWFSEFSDALNQLAESNGWCGAYDEIVRAVGFPGREKNWWVEVEANCTVTDTNPSSRLDSLLQDHYGGEISTTSITFTGKATVRVNSITATDTDTAHNRVTAEDVQAALNDVFSGTVELDDWEIKDSGEEDD